MYNYTMNCPTCNSSLVPIVYGFPGKDLIEMSKRDEVVLGGCSPSMSTHFCLECQEEYRQDGDTHTPMFSHNK